MKSKRQKIKNSSINISQGSEQSFNSSSSRGNDDFQSLEESAGILGSAAVSSENIVNNEIYAEAYSNTPRVSVQSITHQQFPEFSHFFICVTRAFNLTGCAMSSLVLKIRIIPSLPIIQTGNVWCQDGEVNFRCGYALDFKTYAKFFNLGDVTPVIEFYRKSPQSKKNDLELFGFSLLPLSVLETVLCNGDPLTYLMKNKVIDLRQFTTGQIIGYLTVTIALGFAHQQKFMDPDSEEFMNENSTLVQPNKLPVQLANQQNNLSVENDPQSANIENKPRRRKHHKKHHKKRPKNVWIQKAMAFGWKPPGFVDPEWKDKAIEKGWTPPNKTLFSSIGITCTPTECPNLKDIEIQQREADIKLHQSILQPQQSNSTSTTKSSNDESMLQLFHLLNTKTNQKNDEPVSEKSPQKLNAIPVVTLFDKPQQEPIALADENILLSSDSETDTNPPVHQSLLDEVEINHLLAANTNIIPEPIDTREKIPPSTNQSSETLQLNNNRSATPTNSSEPSLVQTNQIKENINLAKKILDDEDDDFQCQFDSETIKTFKEMNIFLNDLKPAANICLSESDDSNSNLDVNSDSDIIKDIDTKQFANKPIDPKLNYFDSDSITDSEISSNANTTIITDSESESSDILQQLMNNYGAKDPEFTRVFAILDDKK